MSLVAHIIDAAISNAFQQSVHFDDTDNIEAYSKGANYLLIDNKEVVAFVGDMKVLRR